MAASRKDDGDDRADLVDWLVGRPEPTVGYGVDAARRWWRVAWPVVVVALVLYFIYGP